MSITIPYELANFILYMLGAVLIGIVIVTFLNINKFIRRIDALLEKNEENISQTVETLPQIAQNINDTTLGIKHGVDKIGETVETVETSVFDTLFSLTGNGECA